MGKSHESERPLRTCRSCRWYEGCVAASLETGRCKNPLSDFYALELRPEYLGCSRWEIG